VTCDSYEGMNSRIAANNVTSPQTKIKAHRSSVIGDQWLTLVADDRGHASHSFKAAATLVC